MPTLVLLRHGKSDWSGGHGDAERPLKPRGRRQAAEAGRWLAGSGPRLGLAVVSPARRAWDTWALVAGELDAPPRVEPRDAAYTFDGEALLRLVRGLDARLDAAALVGHNPALEELLHALTGDRVDMPTSCVAVVRWPAGWRDAGVAPAELVAHGRPPA